MRRLFTFRALALLLAVSSFLPHATAAEDVFTVGGIHVDASGPSAAVAQLSAMAQGRPKAWAILFKRITKPQDAMRLPKLDDASLQRIIRSFSVRNERRSTTRYVADVTYTFSPEGVQRAMQSVGIALTVAQVKRILLVPYAPNYSTSSMWTAALSPMRYNSSSVPFALPGGGSESLSALSFDDTNWNDVEPYASHIHANEAVLVQVKSDAGHLTIALKRVGAGQLPTKSSFDIPMLPGGAAGTYSAAADAAVRGIEEMWKTPPNLAPTGHLIAQVHVPSLEQWGALQSDLAAIANISSTNMQAMDIGEARVAITYLGTPDQLRQTLADHGMVLSKAGGDWILSAGSR
jgi:hypothetical protein